MRKINILIYLLVFNFQLVAQNNYLSIFPLKDAKVTYTGVIQTAGVSKYELYNKARIWLATNCEAIKLDDKEIIVGQGVFAIKYNEFLNGYDHFYAWCTIMIQLKEEKYRYIFSDFRLKYFSVAQGSSHFVDDPIENQSAFKENQVKKVDYKVKELIASLELAMKTTIDDNW